MEVTLLQFLLAICAIAVLFVALLKQCKYNCVHIHIRVILNVCVVVYIVYMFVAGLQSLLRERERERERERRERKKEAVCQCSASVVICFLIQYVLLFQPFVLMYIVIRKGLIQQKSGDGDEHNEEKKNTEMAKTQTQTQTHTQMPSVATKSRREEFKTQNDVSLKNPKEVLDSAHSPPPVHPSSASKIRSKSATQSPSGHLTATRNRRGSFNSQVSPRLEPLRITRTVFSFDLKSKTSPNQQPDIEPILVWYDGLCMVRERERERENEKVCVRITVVLKVLYFHTYLCFCLYLLRMTIWSIILRWMCL